MTLPRCILSTVATALLCCAGCCSVRTEVSPGAPVRDHWRILVMPLNDGAGERRAMENSIYGVTRAQGSSTIAAQCVSEAFRCRPAFDVVPSPALYRELERVGLALPQAAGLDSGKACDLARNLDADMVITGRVLAYECAWFLFIPAAKVRLSLEAHEPDGYRSLWTAELTGRKLFAGQRQLARRLAERAAEEVHVRMVAPESM